MGERLAGTIERVTFHNPENGFCVLRVAVPGERELTTVVGKLTTVAPGEHLEAQGHWTLDRQHGRQFQAEQLQTSPPASLAGIERYLGSGAIRSVGPKLAAVIVRQYKERTLDILDQHTDLLAHVQGIGPKRLKRIRASWHEQREVRRIVLFLYEHGIGTARAVKIYRAFGHEAIDRIRGNPYCLADEIRGIGFPTADQLAQRLGFDKHSPLRAQAATSYALQQLTLEGHTGCPEPVLVERACRLIDAQTELIDQALSHQIAQKAIVREPVDGEPWVFLAALWRAEVGLAQAVRRLAESRQRPAPPEDLDAQVTAIEERLEIALASQQRAALEAACSAGLLVVTGGPGVGKTTLIRALIEVFHAQRLECVLAAPTGRAARRMTEATGHPAKTLHRLLEWEPAVGGFARSAERPLSGDVFIIDEVSMVDVALGYQFLRAVPDSARVVLVGDVDQLPSVGPGRVLADVIESRVVPVVRLTEVFRQARSSRIVTAAHAIDAGQLPPLDSPGEALSDFYFIETSDRERTAETILKLVQDRVPQRFAMDPLSDIQILCPMKRGSLGTRELNRLLQEALNPARTASGGERPQVERFGTQFRQGDRVLQTENNYQRDVSNGDLGWIESINDIEQEVIVSFEGRRVEYDFGDLDELVLAYALSVHKSQGSEYPCVIVPLDTQHFTMLERHLLYTAITRGKRLVVLVGSRRALELAVSRTDGQQRYSALLSRLRAEM